MKFQVCSVTWWSKGKEHTTRPVHITENGHTALCGKPVAKVYPKHSTAIHDRGHCTTCSTKHKAFTAAAAAPTAAPTPFVEVDADSRAAAIEAAERQFHNAAIDYVSALLTNGSNGETFYAPDRPKWLEFARKNGKAFAGALLELKRL